MEMLSNHESARRLRCIPTLAPSSTDDCGQWLTTCAWVRVSDLSKCARLVKMCQTCQNVPECV